jgi:hypothetical protein
MDPPKDHERATLTAIVERIPERPISNGIEASNRCSRTATSPSNRAFSFGAGCTATISGPGL